MVFVEESLCVIIRNGLSVGITCGVARSKSIYETKLFLTFYKKPVPQRKRRTPALLNNSHVFCSSISKVVLKAVENTILLLEIHRTSKKLPLVETF